MGRSCSGLITTAGGAVLHLRSLDKGKSWEKDRTCRIADFRSVYGFFGGETWLWQSERDDGFRFAFGRDRLMLDADARGPRPGGRLRADGAAR